MISFTETSLQIYCWVCLGRILKISRYLSKLSVKLIAGCAPRSGTVLLKDEEFAWDLTRKRWQKFLSQHHVTITALNNLDSVIDKYQTGVFSTICDSPTDAISDCPNIDRVHKRLVMSFFLVAAVTTLPYTADESLGFSVWYDHCKYLFAS